MFTLDLSVRAVLLHGGAALVGERANPGELGRYTFLGQSFQLGRSQPECCAAAVARQAGLVVTPVRLLYIVEHFHGVDKARQHSLGLYYLCEPQEKLTGNLLDALHPDDGAPFTPVLLSIRELVKADLQPAALRDVLAGDALSNFHVSTKHVVINELPDSVSADAGIFRL